MLPLEVPISAVSNLRSRLIMARDTLDLGEFESIGGRVPGYGTFEHIDTMNEQHKLAHGLILETIKAQIDDLDRFYEGLVLIQNTMYDTDLTAAQAHRNVEQAVDALDVSSLLDGVDDARDDYHHGHEPDGG